MAKSNWGITSGFIGKLGNVVGFNWKGINLQRALTKSTDPHTGKQLLQRAKFALAGKLGSVVYEAVYVGFRSEAAEHRSTQSGLFLKYNLENLSGTAEAITVNYEALKLSSDKLRGVSFGTPVLNGSTVSVGVTNTANTCRRVSMADRVYLCALCPEMEESVCNTVGTRADSNVSLTIPATWGNHRVYVYGFVIGASSNNEGLASKTAYIGAFGTASADGPSTGSGTGGNSGGGSSTGSETLTAPSISGTTPFAESTQVTMSGPEGAEIRYTTDGSTPTTSSTLYSAAITLTNTTTVKAIAIKENVKSEVTSKTFTKSSGGSGESEG